MKCKTLAALIFAFPLAGKRRNAQGCAGFTKPPKASDPAYLAENEEKLSRWIVATDKFGTSAGCWN